jgi:hypothetical protein
MHINSSFCALNPSVRQMVPSHKHSDTTVQHRTSQLSCKIQFLFASRVRRRARWLGGALLGVNFFATASLLIGVVATTAAGGASICSGRVSLLLLRRSRNLSSSTYYCERVKIDNINTSKDARYLIVEVVVVVFVDAKCAPSAKHTASRTSWLHTRKESQDVPVNFP